MRTVQAGRLLIHPFAAQSTPQTPLRTTTLQMFWLLSGQHSEVAQNPVPRDGENRASRDDRVLAGSEQMVLLRAQIAMLTRCDLPTFPQRRRVGHPVRQM